MHGTRRGWVIQPTVDQAMAGARAKLFCFARNDKSLQSPARAVATPEMAPPSTHHNTFHCAPLGHRARTIAAAWLAAFLLWPAGARADVLGEYSFLHVTFHSVWHLFLFIFALVMIPFVLLIVTFWRFRNAEPDERSAPRSTPRGSMSGDDAEK